ncbi:alpha/beta hydrolase [Desulfamplus magnetovallimortis]|nr:alpha/beta hydrolase [Desulfamplus magnetovallimortis]
MPYLSPEIEKWLLGHNKLIAKLAQKGFRPTPENSREGLAVMTKMLVTESPHVKLVMDEIIVGDNFNIPVRIYHPKPESPLPVLIYLHGGGHMAGSITVYDPICRKMAVSTSHTVISVDYRLAPENPYPAGTEDAMTVLKNIWLTLGNRNIRHIRRLSIAGDSGGGAMCATVAHMTQNDPDIKISRQILIYPGLDYTLQHESINENGKGFLLEKNKIEWYFDNYFQNSENRKNCSPINMLFTDRFPETLMMTAQFCPLRDEAFAYVDKMKSAGVKHKHLHFDDMIHAFLNMESLAKKQCAVLYDTASAFLNNGTNNEI